MDQIILEPEIETFRWWIRVKAEHFRCVELEPKIWVLAPLPWFEYTTGCMQVFSKVGLLQTFHASRVGKVSESQSVRLVYWCN